MILRKIALVLIAVFAEVYAVSQDQFYRREVIPMPADEVIEVCSIALLPDNKIAVSSRRGEIWIVEGAYDDDLSKVKWTRFAYGLESSFGMHWKDGALYVTTRTDFSRIEDRDGDGEADRYEVISQDWGFSGDYHQFAFGSEPDKNGDVWITLCKLGGNGKWRSWAIKVKPDGTTVPVASGVRSPGGMGMNPAGDVFFTDNQGTWNGTSSVKHIKPGSFLGHYGLFEYYDLIPELEPPAKPNTNSRLTKEMERIPELCPPSILLPHATMGASPTFIAVDTTGGKFGPFEGNMLIGEQSHSQIQRAFVEKVNGVYQGAVWHFLEGFESGLVPGKFAPNGTLFVGGTNRGWGSRGTRGQTLERLRWTGKIPFEATQMKAVPNGFELTFTQPVDVASALDSTSYKMEAWTYIYQAKYGSPEVDRTTPVVTKTEVSKDGLRVTLKVDGLVKGHLHKLDASGLKSRSGSHLWHPVAYYTLNELPK